MSTVQQITYRWSTGSVSFQVLRALTGDTAGVLDTTVANAAQNTPVAFSLLLAKVQSIFLTSDQALTLKAGGVNAVQSLTSTGTPAGGTFTRTFGGQTTAPIPYNATAAQVQAALQALSTIGVGGVIATGGPFPGAPIALTFAGLNAVQPVALTTGNDSGLTGGSSPATTTATTTTGVNPDTTLNLLAGVPLVWDSAGYFAQPFNANVATFYVTNTSGVGAKLRLRTLSVA